MPSVRVHGVRLWLPLSQVSLCFPPLFFPPHFPSPHPHLGRQGAEGYIAMRTSTRISAQHLDARDLNVAHPEAGVSGVPSDHRIVGEEEAA